VSFVVLIKSTIYPKSTHTILKGILMPPGVGAPMIPLDGGP
jgi:hypothetical protein